MKNWYQYIAFGKCDIYLRSISTIFRVYNACSNFTFYTFQCAKNWYIYDFSQMWRTGTKFSQMWRMVTKSSHVWRIGTNPSYLSKIGIKSSHLKNWYQNSHVWRNGTKSSNMWKIGITNNNVILCEEMVLNRYRCQWQNREELESTAKCSKFGGYFINVRNTHVCNIKSDFVRIFHKCKILVRDMWCTGSDFSRAVKNCHQFFTVWN